MLVLHRLAQLEIAAASGLCEADGRIHVVADDEHDLVVLDATTLRTLARLPLFPGALPEEHAARKAAKPDLEALVAIPGRGLLALGSGSRPTRHRGAWIQGGQVSAVDLAPLHAACQAALGDVELNLEAAAWAGGLILGQRGNGRGGRNALLHVDLDAARVLAVHDVALGELGGTPLTLTDACAFADGLLVAAAAEASPDAYHDGAVAGSALAWISLDGRLRVRHDLATRDKIEGLAVRADGSVLLCVDADDRATPSTLYAAKLP